MIYRNFRQSHQELFLRGFGVIRKRFSETGKKFLHLSRCINFVVTKLGDYYLNLLEVVSELGDVILKIETYTDSLGIIAKLSALNLQGVYLYSLKVITPKVLV